MDEKPIAITKDKQVKEFSDELKMARSVVYELVFPFKEAGTDYDSLKIRRPKAKDFKKMTGQDAEQSMKIIAKLAGISAYAVDELDMVDVQRINEVLEGFLSTI